VEVRVRAKGSYFVCVLACLTLTTITGLTGLAAQEGHPLIGTWSGEWGPSPTERSPALIVMEWKTTTLSGVINPGYPDQAEIRVGTLDSTKWMVHLEADSKDERGNTVKVVIDGKLENIGSFNRTLTGTWTRGSVKGNFKLTRE
jgi:hypothetical protein